MVLKMGWKSPSRGSLSGWLVNYNIRSWKITKWMVDEVHALGLWNFDKYTVRPRIIEGVETGILAVGSSFGHYR